MRALVEKTSRGRGAGLLWDSKIPPAVATVFEPTENSCHPCKFLCLTRQGIRTYNLREMRWGLKPGCQPEITL